MHKPISELYNDYAEAYALISSDRNFKEQARQLVAISGLSKPRCLELLAGPAEHTVQLARMGCQVLAVDAAEAMKSVAVANGVPADRYMVADVKSNPVLPQQEHIDLMFCLRYSVGYLPVSAIASLLSMLHCNKGRTAKAVFELHDERIFDRSLSRLPIRRRSEIDRSGRELVCTWPSGDIKRVPGGRDVLMEVVLEWREQGKIVKNATFVSQEAIYTVDDIADISKSCGCSAACITDARSTHFPGSRLVEISPCNV